MASPNRAWSTAPNNSPTRRYGPTRITFHHLDYASPGWEQVLLFRMDSTFCSTLCLVDSKSGSSLHPVSSSFCAIIYLLRTPRIFLNPSARFPVLTLHPPPFSRPATGLFRCAPALPSIALLVWLLSLGSAPDSDDPGPATARPVHPLAHPLKGSLLTPRLGP